MKLSKSVIITVTKVIIFLLLLTVCTYYVARTLKDKDNYIKYEAYYEEKEPFDVLFFGSSRMLNAIFPMELWDEYQLSSYNMSQHSEGTNISYWQIKNAIAHNTPRVAVVDISLLKGGKITDADSESKSYLHKSLDHMPLGKVKYDALRDLTENVDPLEYLFPITIYHNRWNDLNKNDIYLQDAIRKGAEPRFAIESLERCEWSNHKASETLDTTGTKIDAMISLCEEESIELVFTCMPSVWVSALPNVCADLNYFSAYVAERGIPFLNFAKDDSMINYATDFYDSSHVNPSGAKKITACLGEFLIDNYDFEEKSENTKEAWTGALQEYKQAKIEELLREKNAGNLNNYLMLLNDNDYHFEIRVPDESCLVQPVTEDVLFELGVSGKAIIDKTLENIEITVYDALSGEIKDLATFHPQ